RLRQIRHPGMDRFAFSSDGKWLASAGGSPPVLRLWEVVSGQECRQWSGPPDGVASLAFTPDNRTLLTGSIDSTLLGWDWTPPEMKSRPAETPNVDRLWSDLADGDAPKAYRAIWAMAATPEKTLALVRSRLGPAPPRTTARIRRLVADLDHKQFARREAAVAELAKLGDAAEPALRAALADKPSLEMKLRLNALLDRLYQRPQGCSPEELRQLRLVIVLEHIGSRDARDALEVLAKGEPEAPLTYEAK